MVDTGPAIAITCFVFVAAILAGMFTLGSIQPESTPRPAEIKPWPVGPTPPPSYYQNDTATPPPPVVNSTKTAAPESTDTITPEVVIPEIVIRIESGQDTGAGTTVHVDGQTGANTPATGTNSDTETGAKPHKPTKTPRTAGSPPPVALRVPHDLSVDRLHSPTVLATVLGIVVEVDVILEESGKYGKVIGVESEFLQKDSVALRGLEGIGVQGDHVKIVGQIVGYDQTSSRVLIHVLFVGDV